MKIIRVLGVLIALSCVAACGGGGGGGSGGSSSGSTPTPLTLTVNLSASSQSASMTEGATGTTTKFTATYAANTAFSTPVVADVAYDKSIFSSVTVAAGSAANSFDVTATTQPNISGGSSSSPITFRLCQEAACTNVYTGSSATYTYNLTVNLLDWSTFQRNAAHTGYVHATLDPTKFGLAWTWQLPNNGSSVNAMNAVVTGGGLVYTTRDGYFFSGTAYALNEKDGSIAWKSDIPNLHSAGSAAYNNGSLYVPTQDNSEAANIITFNSKDGTYMNKMPFYTQWANFISPTVYGSNVYFGGESSLYGFDPLTANTIWRTGIPSFMQGIETPAVDQNYIYYSTGAAYSNSKIEILNRNDGSIYAEITDPLGTYNGYQYYGSPMLGAANSLIAYSGEASTGLALSSSETHTSRLLARFDISAKSLLWHTTSAYITTPAYAKGVIYAGQNSPFRLDAISETDGSVLWSWFPPLTDSSFHNNIIVVDNLLFVSTDQNVYAIDLTTHKSVWSYKAAGKLTLSPAFILYISTGIGQSDGGLVAIKLQ